MPQEASMESSLYAFYLAGTASVLGISMITYVFFSRKPKARLSWLIIMMVTASAYMPIAQYLKYSSLHFLVDFSHWLQVLFSITKTGKPICLSQHFVEPGTANYFSAHFVPLLYVLAIPFKFWPFGTTVIVLNFVLMASAVIPLYKLATMKGNDKMRFRVKPSKASTT